MNTPLVVPVFVACSASHWILDAIVHLKDLPVLGFDGEHRWDLDCGRRGPLAFAVEIAFYTIVSAFTLSGLPVLYALILGGIFHGVNAPSFLSSSRKNSIKSSNGYAGLALFGFSAFTILASLLV